MSLFVPCWTRQDRNAYNCKPPSNSLALVCDVLLRAFFFTELSRLALQRQTDRLRTPAASSPPVVCFVSLVFPSPGPGHTGLSILGADLSTLGSSLGSTSTPGDKCPSCVIRSSRPVIPTRDSRLMHSLTAPLQTYTSRWHATLTFPHSIDPRPPATTHRPRRRRAEDRGAARTYEDGRPAARGTTVGAGGGLGGIQVRMCESFLAPACDPGCPCL